MKISLLEYFVWLHKILIFGHLERLYGDTRIFCLASRCRPHIMTGVFQFSDYFEGNAYFMVEFDAALKPEW